MHFAFIKTKNLAKVGNLRKVDVVKDKKQLQIAQYNDVTGRLWTATLRLNGNAQ